MEFYINFKNQAAVWIFGVCALLCLKICSKFVLREKPISKCLWCKQKKPRGSDISGWSYVSSSYKCQFHVYCIAEITQEAWKKSAADQDVLKALERMEWGEVVAKSKRNVGKEGHDRLAKTIMLFLKTVACVLLGDVTGILPITITAAELVSKYT